MSVSCTNTTSVAFPVQLQSKPTVTEKYYVEVARCGTAGSYTFGTTVWRKSDSTQIGQTSTSGAITLYNEDLSEKEKPKQNLIKRQVRQALKKAKAFPIGNYGLTHAERTRYLRQLGFQNTASGFSSNPVGKGQYASDGVIYDAATGQPINQGGDDKKNNDEIKFKFDDIVLNLQGRKFRKKYEDLFYPVGLGANKQDRIRFEQIYSEGTKIGGIDLQGKVFQRKQKRINGSVTLPIVTGIADKNEVDWQGASLNPLQALGASGALSLFEAAGNSGSIADAFSNAGSAINEAAAKAKGTVGSDVKQAINIYLAQKAVGAQGLLSKATGAILNPNLEMLFSGPSLRSFDFTFKLSPRDANEATQVRKIIRFFKQGMSVKTSSSNVFLKAPNIFTIRYQTFNTNGEEILHPSLNIIKECALKSCDVQYTPDGTYMTYEDPYRTMTSYQLTLSFGELDPIYDSDYTELDNDQDQVLGY